MATITNGTITLDNASVKNRHFSGVAADRLDVDKCAQLFKAGTCFGLAIGTAPSAKEEIVYVASGAGTIRGFHALLNDTGTASASSSFDLKKNGTTVLSSAVTVAYTDTDKIPKDGTLSVTTFTTGDILSIALAVSASTGASGPYAWVTLDETYCPAT